MPCSKSSYLVESSQVRKLWVARCSLLTPVCVCVLLLTRSVPELLWQGWVWGRRSLNKLPSCQKGGSNTIWGDHNKACILALFIALLCSSNLAVEMVFLVLGCILLCYIICYIYYCAMAEPDPQDFASCSSEIRCVTAEKTFLSL